MKCYNCHKKVVNEDYTGFPVCPSCRKLIQNLIVETGKPIGVVESELIFESKKNCSRGRTV